MSGPDTEKIAHLDEERKIEEQELEEMKAEGLEDRSRIMNTDPVKPKSEDKSKECNKCGSPASCFCTACQEHPFDPQHQPTRYCSAQCQKDDWSEHKQRCGGVKKKRRIFRAGIFLQALFLKYREVAFDMKVDEINVSRSSIRIQEGDLEQNRIFVPFPHHMVQDETVKKALLCYRTCSEAMKYFQEILELVLKGNAARLREVAFVPKPGRLRITKGASLNIVVLGEDPHVVWFIGLPDGLKFAMDITGHQYGFTEPVTPWQDYLKHRVSGAPSIYPVGHTRSEYETPEASAMAVLAGTQLVVEAHDQIMKRVIDLLKRYLDENQTSFRAIFDSSQTEYETHQDRIIEHVVSLVERLKPAYEPTPSIADAQKAEGVSKITRKS